MIGRRDALDHHVLREWLNECTYTDRNGSGVADSWSRLDGLKKGEKIYTVIRR
jgi:hypothetical protein